MTHKLQHQAFVTIQSKPTYEQLEKENIRLKSLLRFTASALVQDAQDGDTIWFNNAVTLWEEITQEIGDE